MTIFLMSIFLMSDSFIELLKWIQTEVSFLQNYNHSLTYHDYS